MARMTPSMNARGVYRLRAPWTIPAGVIYECIAIRSFDDFVDRGIDVVTKVYEPVGLTAAESASDRAEGAKIITLRSGTSPLIFVPDTYIESYPAQDGVAYSQVILSVNLGALPDGENLAFVKDQIVSTVEASFGLTPVVKENVAPSTNYVSADQHEALKLARAAAITNSTTDRARVIELQATVTSQAEQIRALEQILIDNGLLD